ncbi:unnamed protein product [Sphagnum balticum]
MGVKNMIILKKKKGKKEEGRVEESRWPILLFCFVVSVVVGVVGLLWILGSLLALMRKITELGFINAKGVLDFSN